MKSTRIEDAGGAGAARRDRVVRIRAGRREDSRRVKRRRTSRTPPPRPATRSSDSWITLKVHSQFVPEDTLENSDIDVDTKRGRRDAERHGRQRGGPRPRRRDRESDRRREQRDRQPADCGRRRHDGGRPRGRQRRPRDKTKDVARDTKDAAKEATGTTGKAITDGWIKSKIAAQFVTEDSLDNSDIDIDIAKGAVTLNGAVRTMAAKNRADGDREGDRRREGRAEQPEGRSGREVTTPAHQRQTAENGHHPRRAGGGRCHVRRLDRRSIKTTVRSINTCRTPSVTSNSSFSSRWSGSAPTPTA